MTGNDKWIAWQFHDAKDGSGIVQAFRRAESPSAEYEISLRGLDPDKVYEVYDEDKDATLKLTGSQLSSGLLLTLPDPRSSALLRYRQAQ